MAINVIVQYIYKGGFLPDIIFLLTQAPIIVVWFDGVVLLSYNITNNTNLLIIM